MPEHGLVHELAGHRITAEQVADHVTTADAGIGVGATLEKVHGTATAKQVTLDQISTLAVGVVARGDGGQHGSESVEEANSGRGDRLSCGYDTTDGDHRQPSDAASYTADRGEGVGDMIQHGDGHVGVGVLEGVQAIHEASGGGHGV